MLILNILKHVKKNISDLAAEQEAGNSRWQTV
jgi:hypothetical protein